jgi:glycosyltransferase involved in cell wall biosynthesis
LYIWNPSFADALATGPYDLTTYHIDDEYSFSARETPITDVEMKLLRNVNHVFIHSPALLEKKGKVNPHTSFVPNGVDYPLFATPAPEPEDLAHVPHPRIGYTGFIKKQIDWPLLLRLIVRHPEWSFVFVGPRAEHAELQPVLEELARHSNVYFLGAKPSHVVAKYPQHFDVCLMPYSKDDYTKYIYPLKLHEYLASGRPIVGTRLPALEPFANILALPETDEGWLAAIAEALRPSANSEVSRAARQGTAKQHDWELLARKIAETMAGRLGSDFGVRFGKLIRDSPEPSPVLQSS